MPLPKLKSLDLSYNNLPSIPVDVTANLTRLRKLDVSFNDLTTVPVVREQYLIPISFITSYISRYNN
jgi:Leucine-rich repeat (LRR) protein